jgi:hypothetical protein
MQARDVPPIYHKGAISEATGCKIHKETKEVGLALFHAIWSALIQAGTRFEEQSCSPASTPQCNQTGLHLPQRHKATKQDSTLRVEANGLEEQADNAKARDLYWKPTPAPKLCGGEEGLKRAGSKESLALQTY